MKKRFFHTVVLVVVSLLAFGSGIVIAHESCCANYLCSIGKSPVRTGGGGMGSAEALHDLQQEQVEQA